MSEQPSTGSHCSESRKGDSSKCLFNDQTILISLYKEKESKSNCFELKRYQSTEVGWLAFFGGVMLPFMGNLTSKSSLQKNIGDTIAGGENKGFMPFP